MKEVKEVIEDNKLDYEEMELDIYFKEKYIELSSMLEEEGSEPLLYKFQDENGEILNYAIKRPIKVEGFKEQYFDLTTPYGYGGPIISKLNIKTKISEDEKKSIKKKLLLNFEKEFQKYCDENNIIAEFIRFHPILENALDFKKIYNPILLQHTVATRCGIGDTPMLEFSQSVRRNVRNLAKKGFLAEVIEKPQDLSEFQKIYVDTMERNEAKDFYFFDDKYFQFIIDNFQDNLLLVNVRDPERQELAGSELYFRYNNKYIHMHLSATNSKFLYDSPIYLVKNESTLWADQNGYQYIHQGGGTSSDPENSLYLFKKKFTKSSIFDFYIAKKIYNKKIYNALVEKTHTQDSNFFPQYRDTSRKG